mmetsp:Transcript_67106/g.140168  ORF Transcript_67106/g.140168 Transcript_67106/m.140168 type:complete len:213 (+) Transcript_67106:2948-3586(+)
MRLHPAHADLGPTRGGRGWGGTERASLVVIPYDVLTALTELKIACGAVRPETEASALRFDLVTDPVEHLVRVVGIALEQLEPSELPPGRQILLGGGRAGAGEVARGDGGAVAPFLGPNEVPPWKGVSVGLAVVAVDDRRRASNLEAGFICSRSPSKFLHHSVLAAVCVQRDVREVPGLGRNRELGAQGRFGDELAVRGLLSHQIPEHRWNLG